MRRNRVVMIGKRATGLVAVLAVVVLALTGCAGGSGSTAAYVGGESISDTDLDRVTTAISGAAGQQASEAAVLSALVKGRLATTIATQRGIAITDGERDQFIQQQSKVSPDYAEYLRYLSNPDAAEAVYGFANYDLVTQRLGGNQQFVTEAQKIGVRLNPRFGDWVYIDGQMGIRVGSNGSLSTPLPSTS